MKHRVLSLLLVMAAACHEQVVAAAAIGAAQVADTRISGSQIAGSQASGAQISDAQRQLFAYDDKQPLDLKQQQLEERPWARIYAIEYASPRGGRVTGFLVEPKPHEPKNVKPQNVEPRSKDKHAAIVFGHWGPGNATEFLPEAITYARAGVVSVMIDYPWVRPAPWRKKIETAQSTSEEDRDTQIQAVVDLRRAFDVLLARDDVDAQRMAYVGHSYGAQWGAILTAVDRRMCATVLAGGVPNLGAIYLDNQDPDMAAVRQQIGLEKLKKHVEVLSVLDAIHYIPQAAPIPLLFQFARYEHFFDKAAMDRYYAAASQPKEEREYSSGHDLNGADVLGDRARWLAEKLRTPGMVSALNEEIRGESR